MRIPLLIFPLMMAACGRTALPRAEVRPVKTAIASSAATIEKDFAGMATPDDAVNMAFKLSGQILDIPVSVGQSVVRGQLLAELDPREVQLRISADRSAFEEARSQRERMERLSAHEAVSRQQVEAAETRYVQARSAYENSLEELAQTRLTAPFSGVVEQSLADNYERVQAGQTVIRLVAPNTTTVKFTAPESALAILRDSATRYYVRFDNYRGASFAARLKNFSRTSSDASGFPVSLRLVDVDTALYTISPGMSCTITLYEADPVADAVALPLSAIYAPTDGGTFVWIVGHDSRVKRREVSLGDLFGRDRVIVDSGVRAGERVVTAGVYRLADGEQVRVIAD